MGLVHIRQGGGTFLDRNIPSIMGPVIGAAILLPLSEVTRVWLGYKGTGVDMMIYGALIMLISVYQPQGVWGLLTTIGRRAK